MQKFRKKMEIMQKKKKILRKSCENSSRRLNFEREYKTHFQQNVEM